MKININKKSKINLSFTTFFLFHKFFNRNCKKIFFLSFVFLFLFHCDPTESKSSADDNNDISKKSFEISFSLKIDDDKTEILKFDLEEGNKFSKENLDKLQVDLINKFGKENFNFGGWYVDSNFTGDKINIKNLKEVTEKKIFYGRLIDNRIYTVTFNTGVGASAVAEKTVNHGGKVPKPQNNPTKTGFIFVNWYQENSFKNVFNFAVETITANATLYAKFHQFPSIKEEVEIIMFYNRYFPPPINGNTYERPLLKNIFSSAEGETLTYSIVEVFQNGGNTDVKNRFSIHQNAGEPIINSKVSGSKNAEKGYYSIKINAKDSYGLEVQHYLSAQVINAKDNFFTADLSTVNTPITIITSGDVTNYIRTGNNNDYVFLFKPAIVDAGAGNNTFRMDNKSEKIYIYNFKNSDKISLPATYTPGMRSPRSDDFKNFVLSSYEDRNSVEATGDSRLIYITTTGELYRDENGDAVFKESDATIDLKTGFRDKKMAKIYSSAYNPGEKAEDNGTPATFTADSFEIVDF